MKTIEQGRRSEHLQRLSLKELQKYGTENFADIRYRSEVMRRVAKSHGASKAILYDNVADAASEDNKSSAHFYERHLLPGLITATGFDKGAATVVAAPPANAELNGIKKYKSKLENELGRPIDYSVYYAQGDKVYDLLITEPEEYKTIQKNVLADPEAGIRHGSQADVVKQLLAVDSHGKTLIVPYQTNAGHYDLFKEELADNKVSLPDIPEVDKAYNGLLLKESGFDHLPEMYIVGSSGQFFERHEELDAAMSAAPVIKTPDVVDQFAEGVLSAVEKLAEHDMQAYIKLDPSGASGRGNLDPGHYPALYDPTVDREMKHAIIAQATQDMPGLHLPKQAIVEEFIEAKEVEGIPVDVTICGEMVDGVFLPISINPVGTTHGAYDRQWTGPTAESIGDTQAEWKEMFSIYAEMGTVLAENGYRNGVLAGDVFQRKDGTFAQHDYNLRRGGRSVPESLTALEPEAWFDGSVQVQLSDGPITTEQSVDVYHRMCDELVDQGMFPYATGLAYGDNHEPNNVRTFKVLRPMSQLVDTDGAPLPRDQHLLYTGDRLVNIANSLKDKEYAR